MKTRTGLLMIAAGALTVAAGAAEGDWPNWRGPNHDNISPERGLKTRWDTPLPMLWERTLGSAFSGFACVDGRVYTGGTVNDQQTLFCLNADTGEVIWQNSFEKQYRDPQGGDGVRATPAVSDGRVYVFGGHGRLLCVAAADGKKVWEREFNNKPQWGYSGSVLIEGDLCILSPGGGDRSLVALNKATGETVWRTEAEDVVGYATPYPFTFSGTRYVFGFMGNAALIVEAATGREVWRMRWQTDWDVNAAAPIFHEGMLYFGSGYGHGAIVVKLRKDGDKLAADTVWESKVIRNKFESAVLYDGYLYSGDETGLQCAEFATGKQMWDVRRVEDFSMEHSTVTIADGHLFVLSQSGELLIAPASPEKFEAVTRAKILAGRCWTVSTIYKGRIYARDLERVVCFKLTD